MTENDPKQPKRILELSQSDPKQPKRRLKLTQNDQNKTQTNPSQLKLT